MEEIVVRGSRNIGFSVLHNADVLEVELLDSNEEIVMADQFTGNLITFRDVPDGTFTLKINGQLIDAIVISIGEQASGESEENTRTAEDLAITNLRLSHQRSFKLEGEDGDIRVHAYYNEETRSLEDIYDETKRTVRNVAIFSSLQLNEIYMVEIDEAFVGIFTRNNHVLLDGVEYKYDVERLTLVRDLEDETEEVINLVELEPEELEELLASITF
ncbi:hypothetical protein FLK61_40250 [Paenalkalicoccus suaedae]|uniref:Uncharacterized protein n=1 Tax=Paenalkalicoccus suaedae TaxID=2592382 RepID=A0A859FIT9_9BACI|nr:hypothetical protein [Paenalkalicoccus suaedae]QKS72840.1 hypothetical protein FLK61_40250 [Paenalkalicoccus suaedae]